MHDIIITNGIYSGHVTSLNFGYSWIDEVRYLGM